MKELSKLMGFRPEVKVVDATLRDGGLVNDFYFPKGFEKALVIEGIGYKAQMRGQNLVLNIGFANEQVVKPTEGVEIEVAKDGLNILVKGIDSQKVGQKAAEIRAIRKPEPYHGKGIRYKDEVVVLRVSKAKKKEG